MSKSQDGSKPKKPHIAGSTLPEFVEKTAAFNEGRVYRYELTRGWDANKPVCVFGMLNPSTADESVLDPTVGRCVRFADRWGCGSLVVLNIFALRSTDPYALYDHFDPVGPGNDTYIRKWALTDAMIVGGWGVHGMLRSRGRTVAGLFQSLGKIIHCLALTKNGQPNHPLYLRSDTPLRPYHITGKESDAPATDAGPDRPHIRSAHRPPER